ncbi:MAG: hypothetical protein ACTHZ1_07905 [Sphingobacterium sp.]
MKKTLFSLLALATLTYTTSCSDDDPVGPGPQEPGETMVKTGILESDETWTANNIYVLDGRVVVDEGVTLTIEPGTIVKAEDGQNTNASTLIVDRGGKLIANGTAEQPIIFTSLNDEIAAGEKESTLDPLADAGQWGGVIVLGNAPISVANSEGIEYIEGIPSDLSYGEYGGTDAADNSGSLKYVSIRFSGVALEPDAEIQGLTLGGVGNGTTIENIEIYSNKDDGIEWFGGTVDVKNVLIYGQQDDGLDIDQAYSGTIDNALVIQTANSGSAFEVDGPEGNAEGAFTMKNITVDMGNQPDKLIADFREGATGTLENIYVTNVNAEGSSVNLNDNASAATYAANQITFSNWTIDLPEGKTIAELFTLGSEVTVSVDNAGFVDNVNEESTGADLSAFDWTLTKSQGLF